MKTKRQRIKELERLVNNLELIIPDQPHYKEMFDKLERRCWEIETPAEFKKADKVRFSEAKKGGCLFGVFRITDVRFVETSRGSCLPFEWRYSVINMKTGVSRTCVSEYQLSKS